MKITNVWAGQPASATSPNDWRTSLGQMLVAVETDAGLTGYGVGGGGLAGVHVVRTVLRELLLGRSPENVESLWDEMAQAVLPFGQKGLAIMALSGVDLALWDLRGKAEDQPVAELLGGKTGEPIPCYVTLWDDVPANLAEEFRAFKLHIPAHDREARVIETVHAVERCRRTVGDDADVMIDVWMRWDFESTLDVAAELERFGVGWIEEPLPADDHAGYEELVRRSPVPIAGGEHEFTAKAFDELIAHRRHTVLQPDVCWCGGMTELVKIYRAANAAGLRVCPHRGAEVWGLHAVAALDPRPLAESGRPWMTWADGQPEIEDGSIQLGDAPGFGVTFDVDNMDWVVPRSGE